ncbi:hypothetical protein ACLBXM_03580 [Xanthobacteraceae bacterium A53D]
MSSQPKFDLQALLGPLAATSGGAHLDVRRSAAPTAPRIEDLLMAARLLRHARGIEEPFATSGPKAGRHG